MNGAAAATEDLAALGNVEAGYQHHERVVEPSADLALAGARLKWYDLRRPERSVPAAARNEARAFLEGEAAAGRLELGYGLGFVVMHHSDARTYLIVGAWRDNQELWETLYAREHAGGEGFVRWRPGVDGPTLCVWELAPVWHERQAWVRYLWSGRDEAAKWAYLGDRRTGRV